MSDDEKLDERLRAAYEDAKARDDGRRTPRGDLLAAGGSPETTEDGEQ